MENKRTTPKTVRDLSEKTAQWPPSTVAKVVMDAFVSGVPIAGQIWDVSERLFTPEMVSEALKNLFDIAAGSRIRAIANLVEQR